MPMKFLFWQNMISIHQTALLNALASKHQVTLAVQRAFEEERTDSGWKIPDMGNVHLELSPDEQRIHQLILSNETAIHVFSGIDAYPMVFRALHPAEKDYAHLHGTLSDRRYFRPTAPA